MKRLNCEMLAWDLEEYIGEMDLNPSVGVSVLQNDIDSNPEVYVIFRDGKTFGSCKLKWNPVLNRVTVKDSTYFGSCNNVRAFLDVCSELESTISNLASIASYDDE